MIVLTYFYCSAVTYVVKRIYHIYRYGSEVQQTRIAVKDDDDIKTLLKIEEEEKVYLEISLDHHAQLSHGDEGMAVLTPERSVGSIEDLLQPEVEIESPLPDANIGSNTKKNADVKLKEFVEQMHEWNNAMGEKIKIMDRQYMLAKANYDDQNTDTNFLQQLQDKVLQQLQENVNELKMENAFLNERNDNLNEHIKRLELEFVGSERNAQVTTQSILRKHDKTEMLIEDDKRDETNEHLSQVNRLMDVTNSEQPKEPTTIPNPPSPPPPSQFPVTTVKVCPRTDDRVSLISLPSIPNIPPLPPPSFPVTTIKVRPRTDVAASLTSLQSIPNNLRPRADVAIPSAGQPVNLNAPRPMDYGRLYVLLYFFGSLFFLCYIHISLFFRG